MDEIRGGTPMPQAGRDLTEQRLLEDLRTNAFAPCLGTTRIGLEVEQLAFHGIQTTPLALILEALEPLVNPITGSWLDLSGGVLRAVSPIHIQYLKNMGATASMSIALSAGGRLWGLISGHHYGGPLFVPHEVRATCELIGIVCSMQLEALERLAHSASEGDLSLLRDIAQAMRDASICGLGQTAANAIDSAIVRLGVFRP